MVISEVAFLLLQPEKKQKNMCKLKVYASLYSLEKIERDFDVPNKISFFWRVNEGNVR